MYLSSISTHSTTCLGSACTTASVIFRHFCKHSRTRFPSLLASHQKRWEQAATARHCMGFFSSRAPCCVIFAATVSKLSGSRQVIFDSVPTSMKMLEYCLWESEISSSKVMRACVRNSKQMGSKVPGGAVSLSTISAWSACAAAASQRRRATSEFTETMAVLVLCMNWKTFLTVTTGGASSSPLVNLLSCSLILGIRDMAA
mmetsp:Transcript_46720/g.138000  ORF Transcript_46720/g.138000 Transcript_46720/m.138000 type:complete len:201 (+) Transcript_46720:310-912(+)